jgi:hypothetical protein
MESEKIQGDPSKKTKIKIGLLERSLLLNVSFFAPPNHNTDCRALSFEHGDSANSRAQRLRHVQSPQFLPEAKQFAVRQESSVQELLYFSINTVPRGPRIVGSLGLETEIVTSMRGPIAPLDMPAKHSPHRAQRIRSA